MLRDLLPSDLVKTQNPNDWKRSVVNTYNQDSGMSPDDAKVTFLKIIYRYCYNITSYFLTLWKY